MKIIIVASKFPPIIGGGETYTHQLASQLHNLKHEVVVLTNTHPLRRKNSFPFQVVELEDFDESKRISSFTIPQLYSCFKDFSPDIIHVHNYLPLHAVLSVPYYDARIVFSVHNTPVPQKRIFGTFGDYNLERMFVQPMLESSRINRIMVASDCYKKGILEVASPHAPIDINPFGIDEYDFKSNYKVGLVPSLNSRRKIRKILLPSRIIARKGIREAVQALAKLPPNYELTLPAFHYPQDPVFAQTITNEIIKLGLVDRVHIPKNYVKHEEMPSYYDDSDYVLIPSHYEGFGIVLLEAMAMNVPVIATDVSGIREVISHNKTGLLVQPFQPDSIVSAIMRLEKDAELKQTLVQNALNSVRTKFSLKSHMERVVASYSEAIIHI